MRRIIPPNHRSVTGFLPTRFPVPELHYESKLERDFLILLEIDVGLEGVLTQPVTLDLEVGGRRRAYTPDILAVWWEDAYHPYGKKKVVFEVKPYQVLKRDFADLAPKYRAAKQHFASRGVGFRVITDRSIYCARQANAVLLGPAMRRPLSQDIASTIRAIMTFPGVKERTIGEVRQLLIQDGILRETAQQALYHMLGMGFLVADLNIPLVDTTVMKWWAIVAGEEIPIETG